MTPNRGGISRLGVTALLMTTQMSLPASSQDLVYSHAPSADCVDAAQGLYDQFKCIGNSAALCQLQSPGSESSVVQEACVTEELSYWTDRLGQIYQVILDQERTAGRDEELKQMQHAWLDYRESRCAHRSARWDGRPGDRMDDLLCRLAMTAEQALYLGTLKQ